MIGTTSICRVLEKVQRAEKQKFPESPEIGQAVSQTAEVDVEEVREAISASSQKIARASVSTATEALGVADGAKTKGASGQKLLQMTEQGSAKDIAIWIAAATLAVALTVAAVDPPSVKASPLTPPLAFFAANSLKQGSHFVSEQVTLYPFFYSGSGK